MINKLCEPEHLILIVLVLLVALLVVGSGKGLGNFIGPLLKKLFGKGSDVTVNIEGGEMSDKLKRSPCASCSITDPASCPLHQSEHERSLRNEKSISELWINYGELRKEVTAGFTRVTDSITATQQVILTALASRPRGK